VARFGTRKRPLDAGGLSQRDSHYQVGLLALREAARVQRAPRLDTGMTN